MIQSLTGNATFAIPGRQNDLRGDKVADFRRDNTTGGNQEIEGAPPESSATG